MIPCQKSSFPRKAPKQIDIAWVIDCQKHALVDGSGRHAEFVRAWCALAYAFPGLHPDAYDVPEGGWPRVLKRFAAEAWRRADAGELDDGELYPCDAQWSGIFDRMNRHDAGEIARRQQIAADHGGLGEG